MKGATLDSVAVFCFNISSLSMAPPGLSTLRLVISYAPIALYVESLRFNSVLISALASPAAVPAPVTGCVKDLGWVWHLSPSDLLSNFKLHGRPIVASLRHGNTFPLVNEALLYGAHLTGRRAVPTDAGDAEVAPRQTFVHVTYLLPIASPPLPTARHAFLLSVMVALAKLGMLAGASAVCLQNDMIAGAVLLLCQATNVVLLFCLQRAATFVFANQWALEKDVRLTAAQGAAVDAHVVVEDWNASDMDVLVGYSSHLHALTNIPIRIRPWRTVVVISRLLSLVLVAQAAVLASLFGNNTDQVWGSAIWMASYGMMHLVTVVLTRKQPDMAFDRQPAEALRLPPIEFSGRRAALAFIATLQGVTHRQGVGQWDWVDGFMPNNRRRKEWIAEFCDADGKGIGEGSEDWSRLSALARVILSEARTARRDAAFKRGTEQFLKRFGLMADSNGC